MSKGNVIIGNDVWIGSDAVIMSGTTIADGCVVGANTVVRGSFPAYSIIIGNPGVVVKKRFTDDQIIALLAIEWWNWPDEKIKENIPLMMSGNISEFIEKHRA